MKKFTAMLLLFCFGLSSLGMTALGAADTTIFISPEDFAGQLGTWTLIDSESGSFGKILKSAFDDKKTENTKPAQATIEVPADGDYYVWARARDFAPRESITQGTRLYQLSVNGTALPDPMGNHGKDGWAWQQAGKVSLKKGEALIEVLDTAAYLGRCEAIVLSTDEQFPLPETAEALTQDFAQYKAQVKSAVGSPAATQTPAPTPAVTQGPAAPVIFQPDHYYVVLTTDDFQTHMGSWTATPYQGSLCETVMFGGSNSIPMEANPAMAKIGVPADGTYKVMVHSPDFADRPSTRLFKLQIGNDAPRIYGAGGKPGWNWEHSDPEILFQGEYDVKATDHLGNYARFDMVIVTDDLNFTVSDSPENYQKLLEKKYVPGSIQAREEFTDPDRPDDEIAVKLNGTYMTFDVPPLMISDRTMVPFRAIFEALGCAVSWDGENETASGSRNGTVVRLPIGENYAKVNGKGVELDVPAQVVDDRTLVPLRFVSEALGAKVNWSDQTQTVTIAAVIPPQMYLLCAPSFNDIGTWTLEGTVGNSFPTGVVRGLVPDENGGTPEEADPSAARSAVADLNISQAGTYKVWVRSRDFATNQQGTRYFNVAVNDKMLPETFGTHGQDGFVWVTGGTVELDQGKNQLEVIDTSGFYARFDAILLTDDLNYVPSDDYNVILASAAPIDCAVNAPDVVFPRYAKEQADPTGQVEIANQQTKVVFYQVPTSKGQVIQNEIYSKHDGQWVKTKERSEELGYLIMAAASAEEKRPTQDYFLFNTKYTLADGTPVSYLGTNVYKTGNAHWYIPTEVTVDGDTAVLTFLSDETAGLQVRWTLEDDNTSPMVNVDVSFKKDGVYTLGAWEGKEFAFEDFDFALAPYRVQGKRVYEDNVLTTEQFLFTPMGTYTLNSGAGYEITKGVVAEPSWIPQRWVYNDNCLFGISMRSNNDLYRGSLFAPAMGSKESNFRAGDGYNMQYRVISQVGDWFDTYRFIVQDLFDVTDYRQNSYASLNEAIFNTRELMMDDVFSGWDPYDKAFYNMEGKNITSNANPMELVQTYLLTEDKDILAKRAIPSIANLLTRGGLHFNRTEEGGGVSSWESFNKNLPKPIGTPISGYNLNVLGGMYEMSRGGIPYLYAYGLDVGKRTVENAYGNIAPFANNLYLYKYTGDTQYLDRAIGQADEYLESNVYATKTDMLNYADTFTYISYFPNLASLMDLYEFTQDQKYLDAAQYVAQWLATCLWVPGVDGEKPHEPVEVNDTEGIRKYFHYGKEDNLAFWWHGDDQLRVGSPFDDPGDLTANQILDAGHDQVDGWIPSRVGLGNEGSGTFGKSSNIIMSYWVGDFLKLAGYTGDGFYENAARNAIVGRFANYPGYYINAQMTAQMKKEYSYEGPDYTGIYWHHIPPFLAMLEDFLINMTAVWSDQKISFPSLRQQGYAYFNSNQYGYAPGTFFDQEDMWLWLDKEVMDTGSMQVDWLGARKDGMAGFALLNESPEEITTTVSLGSKVPGGAEYSGKATVFDKEGNSLEVDVEKGKFTVTIPAKSLRGVTIALPQVQAPAFSKMNYTLDGTADLGQTVAEHTNGKGMVLQLSPESYFAYIYVTDQPADVKSVKMTYQIGEEEKTVSTDIYPYEFIIEEISSAQAFTYTLELTKADGSTQKLETRTIRPVAQ